MYGLAASPVGRIVVFATASLALWHAAHHLRHLLLELGLKRLEAPICYVLYGLALLGTVSALRTVATLEGGSPVDRLPPGAIPSPVVEIDNHFQ